MTPDGAAVLEMMSGDLTAVEWARILGLHPADVRAYCGRNSLTLREAPLPIEVVRLRAELAGVVNALHDALEAK